MTDKLSMRQSLAADLRVSNGRAGFMGGLRHALRDPGFAMVVRYRISNYLLQTNKIGRLVALWLWRGGVVRGCHLPPQAFIGPGLHLPHPIGIVIGEGVVIGSSVTLLQNVTLGRSGSKDASYPVIGDGVTIYTGATIIGSIKIGDGAIVGAHALVNKDVPSKNLAIGSPANNRLIRSQ